MRGEGQRPGDTKTVRERSGSRKWQGKKEKMKIK